MDITQKLEPVIEAFLSGLNDIERQAIDKRTEVERLIETRTKENEAQREQQKENNLNHKRQQEKLNEEIDNAKAVQRKLQSEIDRSKTANKEIIYLKRKAEDTLKNAEAERSLALDKRRELEIKIKRYEDKMIYLQDESRKYEKRVEDMVAVKISHKTKNIELIKWEERNIKESQDISIREIDLKTKFKALELERKRDKVNV